MIRDFLLGVLILASTTAIVSAQNDSESPSANSETSVVKSDEVKPVRAALKRVANAIHMHQQHLGTLPPAMLDSGKKDGVGLSWRVHLLPFLGYVELYEAFDFNEPWNSSHNKQLLPHMPVEFLIDAGRPENASAGRTRIQSFKGEQFVFGGVKSYSVGKLPDGAAATIMAVVTSPDRAVPWTQPDTLTLSGEKVREAIVIDGKATVECITVDGRLLSIPPDVNDTQLLSLATATGKEDIDDEFLLSLMRSMATAKWVDESEHHTAIHEKLRKLHFGMANYHDVFHHFPLERSEKLFDETGAARLSWRVHILPFIGHKPLYERFRLDESWDSPANRRLLEYMPDVFQFPGTNSDNGQTRFQVFSGQGALFHFENGARHPARYRDMSDGTGSTILLVVAGADKAVPWTAPQEVRFNSDDPLAGLGTPPSSGWPCLMADGKPRSIKPLISHALLTGLITPKGNELLHPGLMRKFAPPLAMGESSQPQPSNDVNVQNETRKKLKRLGMAAYQFHDIYLRFGAPENPDHLREDGKPKLSWRVYYLPFIGQQVLFKKFRLDEDWNSPHNSQLLSAMPDEFRSPGDDPDSSKTRFQILNPVFAGGRPKTSRRDITDGVSTTIMVAEVAAEKAVAWTQPNDVSFDKDKPLESIGKIPATGLVVLMCDGATRVLSPGISAERLSALVTHNGKEVVSLKR